MKILLIGHRGTGKSKTAEAIKKKFNFNVVDLDFYIELNEKKSIKDIFEELGEKYFRSLELKYFDILVKNNERMVLSLGAGFELEKIDQQVRQKDFHVIWLRRRTDEQGKIFFNRPLLDKSISAIESYKARFKDREATYLDYATEILTLPEGEYSNEFVEKSFERIILKTEVHGMFNWLTTLTSKNYKQVVLKSNIEIRTDLIKFDFYQNIKTYLQDKFVILSIRRLEDYIQWTQNMRASQIDWAIELGELPLDILDQVSIISYHERDTSTLEEIRRKYPTKHIKWSPIVDSFLQLKQFDSLIDQINDISFLPRSDNGRWSWYRLLRASKQKINFYKIYDESAKDQPNEFEVFYFNKDYFKSAAVIGSPIEHSFSPQFHQNFFRNKEVNFFQVEVYESEFKEALSFLIEKKFVFFAITSPLKIAAYNFVSQQINVTETFESFNTLIVFDSNLSATNTDLVGFKQLMQVCEDKLQIKSSDLSIQVWGGGGVLKTISSVCSSAEFVSVRTGLNRFTNASPKSDIDILIWAAGPSDPLPNHIKTIKCVVDLNYVDWSLARQLAIKCEGLYISGQEMFEAQAKEQQAFYQTHSLKRL